MYYLWLYDTFGQFCPAKNGLIYFTGSERGVGGGKSGWVSLTDHSGKTIYIVDAVYVRH